MKIVYIIDHLRPDGSQRVLLQLVKGLAGRGHRQAIVCLNSSYDPELIAGLRAAGAEVRVVGKLGLAGGYGLAAILSWMRREQFDVAVTLLFAADVLGRTLARLAGIPRIVSSIRARNTNYAWWMRAIVRQTMRLADAVVVNSESIRGFAIADEGAPEAHTIFIPNGVEPAAYREPVPRSELRLQLRLPAERLLIGSVGRLTYQKGFDILLEAFARLERGDIDLLLVGRGEQEARLRTQAGRLGIQERVHFAGYRQDVPRLLGALDLYVHPARWEGMPNALLEAMAAGCPIVAAAVDGSRELIEDGVHGWLVPPDDPAALAQAIDRALRRRPEAVLRAQAACERAKAMFSVEAMVTAWEAVLRGDAS